MPHASRLLAAALSATAVLALPLLLAAQDKVTAPRTAGPVEGGYLLPNGWTITPAGEQVVLPDLPLNILPLADGKRVLVSNSGYNDHDLSLIDLEKKKVVARQNVRQSWFGLAHDPATDRLWWAGGGSGLLHTFNLKASELERTSPAEPDDSALTKQERNALARRKDFTGGVTFDPSAKVLYTLGVEAGTIMAADLTGKAPDRIAEIGGRPYDVAVARNGSRLYVSDWAGRAVLALDPSDLRVVARIGVGEHPNQIAVHPKDDRIFVACASSNSVSVIDTKAGYVVETIMTSLFPRAPEGSTPDAVAVSPDGETLYVANADNNCVAVVDVAVPGKSGIKGFIPTGWYPTAVAVTPDGESLLVGVGKGNQTRANPLFAEPDAAKPKGGRGRRFPYIGTTLSGALSVVPIPDEKALAAYTEQVYKNCPYSDELLVDAPHPVKTAIPTKVGDPSPIKHVIYIIKENRTYDQVFGDIEKGNGDPNLVMFGREVTPNHHKLAEEFVLLDNLYCNGQVSRDGHPWSTMAYNTDYVARDWMLTYSRREGIDDDDEGNLTKAPSGYIWDACARAGLTYRSYREAGRRVSEPDGTVKIEASVPGLVGHMAPNFGIPKEPGGRARDTDNVEEFLREFREFEKNDSLPRFIVMSLGEDHTSGTTPGAFTPEACVASNDLALGRLVDAVSKSRYWKETAIFVIEDDAQNGPDHVDAHRTVGLVVSPYTKRQHLDSTQYQTVSMIRTMELILGLPPLSQFDAAARPMFESFTDVADLTPYDHLPARIDLEARNSPLAYGAERSSKMDFSEYDRIDDFELNEILWHAVKGADAPQPPAVRRAIAYRALRNAPR
ncbi:bifunctional YncE family protein/alkaline phosphatase family protein [Planctomyces sp. SH-PL62]|uniref:bifunctional YncE family protein/alkaline phosphatase family protein n=1 Tax=Planctomyces sp. SH-PL62 TaxID=1636152 RepID=UPI00078EC5DA|nr:bifunctional YncE family protein/alkaline phosphatase family protein [Planctomyces sp. SH-PL62]AMV37291.1 Phosphoesterase family protein [Planctomyces sp. SH-PL62]